MCGSELYSPWRSDIIAHLKKVHKSKEPENKLIESMILPLNLAIICCKAPECESEAVFLARDVATVEKMLKRHAEKRHRGITIEECYNLGCRVCSKTWKLEEVRAWENHCRKHLGLIPEDESPEASRKKAKKKKDKSRQSSLTKPNKTSSSKDGAAAKAVRASNINEKLMSCSLCEQETLFSNICEANEHLASEHSISLVKETSAGDSRDRREVSTCPVMKEIGDKLRWPSPQYRIIAGCSNCNKTVGNSVSSANYSYSPCFRILLTRSLSSSTLWTDVLVQCTFSADSVEQL